MHIAHRAREGLHDGDVVTAGFLWNVFISASVELCDSHPA